MFHLCRNGRCRNTAGGVTCDCATGYQLTRDGRNCQVGVSSLEVNKENRNISKNTSIKWFCLQDIDECGLEGVCPPPGSCQNVPGSHLCRCPQGFELDSAGKVCVDTNECLADLSLCRNGFCRNSEGGFSCECQQGWEIRDHVVTSMAQIHNIVLL